MWGCGVVRFVDELEPYEVAAFWVAGLALSALMAPAVLYDAREYWGWVRGLLRPALW
jgi:hypothetical protein